MIIYILFLIVLSFFFSSSESALTSLPDYKIRKLYIKYKILKHPFNIWVLKPYRILITIIISNTIVNLFLGYLSTKVLLDLKISLNREIKEVIIWLFTTFVVIIFCELMPKIIGKNFSEKVSQISLLPLYILQYFTFIIFSPILYFVEKYLSREQNHYFTKIDELRKVIADASKQILQKDINEFLERAVKFEDVKIKDIFVPKDKVVMIDISKKNFQDIITELMETGKTRIPLCNGSVEKIVGYALIKDLFYLCSTSECAISDIIHPILEVSLKDKAKDILKKFKETQILIAKVVDDNKKFCGIVTLEDIIEELVGEVLDEYDLRFSNK